MRHVKHFFFIKKKNPRRKFTEKFQDGENQLKEKRQSEFLAHVMKRQKLENLRLENLIVRELEDREVEVREIDG